MNYKTVNIIFLTFLILLILSYLIPSVIFVINAEDSIINERFYPTIVSSLALVLSLVKLVENIRKGKDERTFTISNLRIILITFLITIVYIISWYIFRDFFYIFTFIFVLALSLMYSLSRNKLTKKIVLRNSLVSIIMTLVILVIFGQIFSVRF